MTPKASKAQSGRERLEQQLANDQEFLKTTVREALEEVLEAEMEEALGAGKGERTAGRLGYRSGYYTRGLVTRIGKIELRVPQDGQGHFRTDVFERYQRSEKALVSALAETYVAGVSTRKVKKITEELCGHSFSVSAISAIVKKLDEQLAAFAQRRLEEPYPYLILDARYEKVREGGVIRSQAVLVAVGVGAEGRRAILSVELAGVFGGFAGARPAGRRAGGERRSRRLEENDRGDVVRSSALAPLGSLWNLILTTRFARFAARGGSISSRISSAVIYNRTSLWISLSDSDSAMSRISLSAIFATIPRFSSSTERFKAMRATSRRAPSVVRSSIRVCTKLPVSSDCFTESAPVFKTTPIPTSTTPANTLPRTSILSQKSLRGLARSAGLSSP